MLQDTQKDLPRLTEAPHGFHESWIMTQQFRPKLNVATLVTDDLGRVMLVFHRGRWTLPTVRHSCHAPGVPEAAERALSAYPWLKPRALKLEGVYDPPESEDWYAVVCVRAVADLHRNSSVRFISSPNELSGLAVDPLVQAALATCKPGWSAAFLN